MLAALLRGYVSRMNFQIVQIRPFADRKKLQPAFCTQVLCSYINANRANVNANVHGLHDLGNLSYFETGC